MLSLRQHGGQVQIDRQAGVVQPLDERKGVGGAVQIVRVHRRIGLQRQMHAVPRCQVARLHKERLGGGIVGPQRAHTVLRAAEHQRRAVQAVGKLERLRRVVQQVLGVGGVKDIALLAVPDALQTGHREAPAVFEVAAEQQRTRQVFIRRFGENAGRGQLQAGEARLLHGRIYGFVIVLLPCNVRDGKLIARHGSVPPTAHKARNIIQFLLFCAKVIAAAAQKRRVATAQVVVKRGLGQFIVPIRFAGHGGVDLGGRDRRRAEVQQLYISGAGSLHIRPETA